MKKTFCFFNPDRPIVITAEKGCGKTAFIKRIISYLINLGIPYTGFYAEGAWWGEERQSFTLTLIPESVIMPLCDRITESWIPSGRFRYNPEALRRGKIAVERAFPGELIVMDEIGLQELSGRVWAETLTLALTKNQNPLILSIQYRYLDTIMSKWNLNPAFICDGKRYDWDVIWSDLVKRVRVSGFNGE